MNYRSVADLNVDIKQWIAKLPRDFEVVVGIPRSGLLAANLLALYLNLPLTDVEGLCEGRIMYSGLRSCVQVDMRKERKVLIVDDSLFAGTEIAKTRERINKALLPHKIFYGVVYITPEGKGKVDFWNKIVNKPRVFEWNLMHHSVLPISCVDIDGVLCRDPSEQENDDGEQYKQFLSDVPPLFVPTKVIGWLVTCRLEKYRDLTIEWLKKHKIQYKNLIMMNFPDRATRIASGSHAAFKTKVYEESGAWLFIESSKVQAQEIAKYSGKAVFCVETGRMYRPSFFYYAINNPAKVFIKLKSFIRRILKKICLGLAS
ncbi:MAG: orotate phosphoribosyltransferase [Candidatus Omnitrophota bacterium]